MRVYGIVIVEPIETGFLSQRFFVGNPLKNAEKGRKILRLGYLRDWKEEVKSYVRYHR